MRILLSTTLLCAATISVGTGTLQAQYSFSTFAIDGYQIQMHGFASQGFALSNDNNYLTMDTSKGSFAFTDGGLNLSTHLNDKLRVGAQGYIRQIGQLGGGRFSLDWAFIDYKWRDWMGFRAGKVKTALGLYNDTQDAESLHTWALLPQALYPSDLRTSLIAHTGGDVYGEINLHKGKAGSLSYTAYIGRRSNDTRNGYFFNTQDTGIPLNSWSGYMAGADVRWNTPLKGLMVGGSFVNEVDHAVGTYSALGAPYTLDSEPDRVSDVYADYTIGKLRLDAEARWNNIVYAFTVLGNSSPTQQGSNGWFASAAYRLTSKLEVGAYNSRFFVAAPSSPEYAANHIFDQTATVRYDITHWWDVKVEGHFINGYGDTYSARGFYLRDNPDLKPTMNMLVVRTGFYF
jgi:hypothetical protein